MAAVSAVRDIITSQASLISEIKQALISIGASSFNLSFESATPLDENTAELHNVKSMAETVKIGDVAGLLEGTVSFVDNSDVAILRSRAFGHCSDLERVNLPNCSSAQVDAFMNCTSLKEIYMDSYGSVASTTNPFSALSALETLHLNGASTIVASAFPLCANLKEISFNSISIINAGTNKTTLERAYIRDCDTINTNAFNGCKNMSVLYAPNVSKVNGTAFVNCGLNDLVLPALTTIVSTTFNLYTACVNVRFDALPSFSFNALFAGRTSLRTFYAPLVEQINANTFSGCTNLQYADFPNASLVLKQAFLNCTNMSYAYIPLATKVSEGGFQNCNSLESVNMPLVTNIAANGFMNCYAMPSFSFRNVSNLGANAFNGCSSASKIYLHFDETLSKLTIGAKAFVDCVNLKDLYIDCDFIPTFTWSSGMFANSPLSFTVKGGTIHVRGSLVESFLGNAVWKSVYHNGDVPIVAIEEGNV